MLYKILILMLLFIVPAYGADNESLVDKVDSLREQSKPESNKYQGEVETVYETMKEAKPIDVVVPSYNIFAEDQAKITDIMGLPDMKKVAPSDEGCIDPEQLGNYRIYVLISSTVPEVTLKNYMRDALRLNGNVLLVLRGVIGSADYIKPTQDFITTISCGKKMKDLKVDEKCDVSRVDINPILFSLFNVKKVPAVVYSKLTYEELMIRANTGKPLTDDEYFIIKGDTSISYALEKFQNVGADTSDFINILKGSY